MDKCQKFGAQKKRGPKSSRMSRCVSFAEQSTEHRQAPRCIAAHGECRTGKSRTGAASCCRRSRLRIFLSKHRLRCVAVSHGILLSSRGFIDGLLRARFELHPRDGFASHDLKNRLSVTVGPKRYAPCCPAPRLVKSRHAKFLYSFVNTPSVVHCFVIYIFVVRSVGRYLTTCALCCDKVATSG